jgi:hypothetical protein
MQYGFIIESADIRSFGGLALEAEQAGWDAIFVADAIAIETPQVAAFPWFDPWVVLAAMAANTQRIRLGTMITPVPRRRPWKLARETSTLDHLSAGRVILAVGLGAARDDGGFYKVGEAMELKVRAQLLDEGLEILDGLWGGKPFSFAGQHHRVEGMTMLPAPMQSPRIPVWVVGVWPKPKSMHRALKWDGIIPQKYKASPSEIMMKPSDIEAIKRFVDEHRIEDTPFDIVAGGQTPAKSRKRALETVRPYIDAGATWWIESVWSADPSKGVEKARARIKQGPPRVR